MLDETSELPHDPADDTELWQENLMWAGWDEGRRFGFTVHAGRIARTGRVEVKATLYLDGRRVSRFRSHVSGDLYDLPGFRIDVGDPFANVRMLLSDNGYESVEGDWHCDRAEDSVPFGFDITAISVAAPHDWTLIAGKWGMPEIVHDHYEVGAFFRGTARVGDRTVEVSGLMHRDHSWGPRNLARYDMCLWTPLVFPDAFVSAATFLAGGNWFGITVVDTGDGPDIRPQSWVRLDGFPDAYQYYSGAILVPGAERDAIGAGRSELATVDCRVHLPVRYPSQGRDFYWSDALGVARWGDRTGVGNIEVSRCRPTMMPWPDFQPE